MSQITRISGAVLIAVVAASCGDTPTSPSEISGPMGSDSRRLSQETLSSADHEFARFAGSFLTVIVEMSRLAYAAGDLRTVKFFAFQMVQNFTVAQTHLQQAAPNDARGTTLSATDQRAYDAVAQVSGSELDRLYLTHLTQLLQSAIPHYRQEASSGSATSIRGHASHYASDLSDVLARAQELARRASACSPGRGNTTICGSRVTGYARSN